MIENELKSLPEPQLRRDLTASIMARISAIEATELAMAAGRARSTTRPSLAWLGVAAGATTASVALAYNAVGELALDLASVRFGANWGGAVETLPVTPATALITAGLALYAAGLLTGVGDEGIES